jgi:hypothetical protein
MKMIQSGITRTVYIIGKYAFKVPTVRYGWEYFIKGILANLTESKISEYHHRYLRPVRRSRLGLLLIMPKVEVLDREFTEEEMEGLRVDMDRDNVEYDLKPDNFGYLEGKLYCIDYGMEVLRLAR